MLFSLICVYTVALRSLRSLSSVAYLLLPTSTLISRRSSYPTVTDEGEETAVSPGDRRQYGRVVVAVLAAATLVLAAAALPAVVGSGAAPALSLVPLEQANAGGDAADAAADAASGRDAAGAAGAAGAADATGATGGATNLSGSELGALSSAESTRIGGQTAPGSGDNPLRNQSTEIHFVVESEQPSYWRTGAYGEYTGQGFERVDDTQSFDGRVDPGPLRGERVAYEVRLRQSATALPTVWRPARVDTPEGTRLAAGTSLSVTDGVPAGTTYRGVSYAPAREPVVLRTAGRNYPAAVREQYLGLPDDPDTERVARFTDNLTSDASTPYTTAVKIEEWLETNKEYSLSATHDPADGTVASQFVFEMSTGYCEYFAATMTAMLRTQNVPARYVVGYSTGQQTAPGEYTVRAMNAHAWVEVYFPDVGWVRFDPTPGSSRLTTERRAFADGTDQSTAAYNPDESGSPGESFTPAQTPTGGDETVDGATAEADGQRANATGQTANGTGVTSGTATNESGTVTGGERTATGEDSESGTTDSGRETGTPPTGEDTTTTVTERVTGTPAGDVTATGDRTNTSGTTTGGEGTTSSGTTTTDDQTTEDETTTDDQTTEDETTTDDQTTEDETTTDDQTDDTRENNDRGASVVQRCPDRRHERLRGRGRRGAVRPRTERHRHATHTRSARQRRYNGRRDQRRRSGRQRHDCRDQRRDCHNAHDEPRNHRERHRLQLDDVHARHTRVGVGRRQRTERSRSDDRRDGVGRAGARWCGVTRWESRRPDGPPRTCDGAAPDGAGDVHARGPAWTGRGQPECDDPPTEPDQRGGVADRGAVRSGDGDDDTRRRHSRRCDGAARWGGCR